MSLLAELKRRNVIRMAGLYLVGAWLLVQVAGTLLPAFEAPAWVMKTLVGLLALGFVPAIIFAWVFELTPEGIKRDADVPPEQSIAPQTARRMDRTIIAVLLLALGYFAVDKFAAKPGSEYGFDASKAGAKNPASKRYSDPGFAKSIAVLPFESLSEDKANAYFADGIQDQILTGLAKIGDLKVISRTSTQRYAAHPDNLSQIAQELGVAHILEGSVQRAGNRVRINVQLIEAAGDSHLWADTYDRTLDDVFAVESEVAEKIAGSLAATLTGSERSALARKPTENAEAYSAYLKARVRLGKSVTSRAGADEILQSYREAVRLDPGFALAWAELARIALRTGWSGLDPSGELQEEARQALARATALAPDLPQVEMARATYLYYVKRDFAGALAMADTAKAKLPGDSEGWLLSGLLARRLGDWSGSTSDLEHARTLAPNDADLAYHLAVNSISTFDCAQALELFDASLALQSDNANAIALKQRCFWMLGDLAKAGKALAQAGADAPVVEALKGEQALFERDYASASRWLRQAIATDHDATQVDDALNGYIPASVEWQLLLGLSEQRAGAAAASRAAYEAVKTKASAALDAKPENRYAETSWHLALGVALAGLGEREAAALHGNMAVTLIPESSDRLEAPYWQTYLSRIYALNGDAARAVPLARHLLETNASYVSAALLRIDPVWDAVRSDQAFVALTKDPAPMAAKSP